MTAIVNYPDVPVADGVPPVPRAPGAQASSPTLLTQDDASAQSQTSSQQWGVFDGSGNPVLTGDSVLSVGYRRELPISKGPVEEGAFLSYNKVATPIVIRVGFTVGGDESNRVDFLNQANSVLSALTLYTIITPEIQYANMNATRVDYERTSKNGVTLLVVDVWFEEVRITAAATYTNTASTVTASNRGAFAPSAPAAADPLNLGPVQAGPSNGYFGNAFPAAPGGGS